MNGEYPDTGPHPAPGTAPQPDAPEPVAQQGIPIPLHKPRATIVLLVIIGVVFVLQVLTDSLNVQPSLTALGAEINAFVARGEYWRLLTAMFLHFGIPHVVFNGWALLSLGQEVEAFYGTRRFVILYFLTGLFSSMASYLLAPPSWLLVPSAGASGAIFGIVGADVAFFLGNRRSMGKLGQRQLGNLAILIGINLAIGFTPGSGINNYAHLGGLVAGLGLGLGLAPRYGVAWDGITPRLVDTRPAHWETLAVAAIILLTIAGVYLGDQRWLPYLPSIFR